MKNYVAFYILLLLNGILYAQTDFNKYVSEGSYCLQQKEYINAIKKYSKALEYKADDINPYKLADVYIYRAFCRFSLLNSESALADLDLALKIKPEYSRIYQLKSSIYFSIKDLNKSIEWCDKGLAIKPNDDELSARKAKSLTGLKKYDESNKVYTELISENPKNVTAFKMIGNNYQMKKNWDSAQVYFSMAIQLNPLDFESFYDRGICNAEKKDFVAALKDIEHAMQLDSNERYVGYNNIAYFIKLEEKDYEGAIKYFDKAIILKPSFAYSYSNRGFAKMKLGDIKGAYKDIKTSIEMDNKNSYAYKNLALVNIEDGKKTDACYNLKKALELGYKEMYDDEVEKLLKEKCGN
jgi:tetratricopeptide (TPR) repeat protein